MVQPERSQKNKWTDFELGCGSALPDDDDDDDADDDDNIQTVMITHDSFLNQENPFWACC
jgi:hypothetical protein